MDAAMNMRALRAAQVFGFGPRQRLRQEFHREAHHEGRRERYDRHGHDGGHSRGRGGGRHGGFGGGFGPGFGFPGFPGGGFGFGGGHRRRGSRASRGDIRLAALGLLAEQPMHGYQLMREISTRSEGVWRPSPGAIYPALQQLEDEGLIEPERAEGKRVFTLTADGRQYVEEHRAEIDAVWQSTADSVDEDWTELATTGKQVMQAFWQVITAGNRRQVAAATELMADTRRKLYRILAEDEADDAPADGEDDTPTGGTDDTPRG
ncbi:MAG TPA: PadR family transcriptional regulator [Actinocatenispora sp.]